MALAAGKRLWLRAPHETCDFLSALRMSASLKPLTARPHDDAAVARSEAQGASHAHGSWVHEALEEVAHVLPAQAPMDSFVHHNTLHAYEHLSFHDAIDRAEAQQGAHGYLSESAYREAYHRGRITDEDLDRALHESAPLSDAPRHPRIHPGRAARVMLLHEISMETPAGLHWRLSERAAATTFAPSVLEQVRHRIERVTGAWLQELLTRESATEVATRLVSAEGGERAVGHRLREQLGCALDRASMEQLLHEEPTAAAVLALWRACEELLEAPPSSQRKASQEQLPRQEWARVCHEDPNDKVHPLLIAAAGAFLDRGQAQWPMPDRERGFFQSFCLTMSAGRAPRPVWLRTLSPRLRRWLKDGTTPEEAIEALAQEQGVTEAQRSKFVEDTLWQLPGWGGMFHRLEKHPFTEEPFRPQVRLVDFLAVRALLDTLALADLARRLGPMDTRTKDRREGGLAAVARRLASIRPESSAGPHELAWPVFQLAQHLGLSAPDLREDPRLVETLARWARGFDTRKRLRIWHEAYEGNYRDELVGKLRARHPTRAQEPVSLQVLTCIDDRFESLRRHLEERIPGCETFGVAGFFNLAFFYQGLDELSFSAQCPVGVSPRHRIREVPLGVDREKATRRQRLRYRAGLWRAWVDRASRSLLLGPLVATLAGATVALPLLARVFAPARASRASAWLRARLLPAPRTRLSAEREASEPGAPGQDELLDGFTIEEKVERVSTLLRAVGLKTFAPLVLVLGHDATSVNNPLFAGYACGACGGRGGGPNARLFARMANRPEVRARLKARGLAVPDETVFLGAVYNTTIDQLTFFDEEDLPTATRLALAPLQPRLERACQANAQERCKRLASAPHGGDPLLAHRHVLDRSTDLSQARPELNHVTNATCVVGRRALTKDIFFDRRAFLVSYDPTDDDDGAILERTLLAVVPVCCGINLEYFFSTTDPERFGAGTKLPHNVTGLLGTMNGASSDLRTGLPRQMTEIHEPVRLQMIIEAAPTRVLAVLERQPPLKALCDREWLALLSTSPEAGTLTRYAPRTGFTSIDSRKPEEARP